MVGAWQMELIKFIGFIYNQTAPEGDFRVVRKEDVLNNVNVSYCKFLLHIFENAKANVEMKSFGTSWRTLVIIIVYIYIYIYILYYTIL